MDTFAYILVGASAFGSIFLLGWYVGCWFISRENEDLKWDYCGENKYWSNCKNKCKYTNDFYDDYYHNCNTTHNLIVKPVNSVVTPKKSNKKKASKKKSNKKK